MTYYHYGTPEYHAYTSEFEYNVYDETDNYIGEEDTDNCLRYRISEDENYFIDVYEDGCVYKVIVNDIENLNRQEYMFYTLIGTKGLEHHAMKSMFKIIK